MPHYTYRRTGWATVIAVDPGGTTGWAIMSVTPGDLAGSGREKPLANVLRHFAAGQITGGEQEQCDQLIELVDLWSDAAVVSESFVRRIGNTGLETDVAFSPVRINAVLRWYLWSVDRFLFRQSSSMALSRWTAERLREVDWYESGSPHANDAVSHAACFLGRCREQDKLRVSAWPELFLS